MKKISVVLATRNEEGNIRACLESVKEIADEIIVVDEYSKDKTTKIAKSLGAKVFLEPHHSIFHITKQKALLLASGDWVLQLDADERVTPALSGEIKKVINLSNKALENYQKKLKNHCLFLRHQKLIERRDGKIGNNRDEYAGFFVPRRNFFLGKYLKYGGTYPDGVIRLLKKGRAHFPCKSVHEQIVIDGKVGWLEEPLLHISDIDFKHYLKRNSYYINLMVDELKEKKMIKNLLHFVDYLIIKPLSWFLWTLIRHKGILDGWQGVVFSFFSALRFPRTYLRYIKK